MYSFTRREVSTTRRPRVRDRALKRIERPALLWVSTLYFAEGFPYSLVHQVSSQLFVALGATPFVVGLTSLYGIAWNFKFLMGPLVDGTATLKRWIVRLEILLAVVVLAVVVPISARRFATIGALFAIVAILAATHDVAVDGFYIASLAPEKQAALSGVRVAPYRLAMLAGSGGLVILAGVTSFRVSLLVAAVVLAGLAFFHARVLREERKEPAGTRNLVAALRAWIREPRMLVTLLFLLTYRAGDALMFAMNAPYLSSLGLGTTSRGVLQGVIGTLCSIGGAALGGVWIARRGLARTLSPIALMQASAIGLYVVIAALHAPMGIVAPVVAIEQLVSGVGTAGLMVFILERSQGDFKASRFAVLTAIMSFATTGAGAVSGLLVEAIGYPLFFLVALLAALPGVALSWRVPKGEMPHASAALRSPL